MELFLLPLLVLGALLATLDGGSDDDGGGGGGGTDNSGNDTLTGDGNDVLRAGAGNDLLTLEDDAEGFGGTGNDTLTASDDARGYGMDGNDSLTASGNAGVIGGAGQDTLSASGDASAFGMEGNDSLTGSGNATVMGGDGSDRLTTSDNAAGYGGSGGDWLAGEDSSEIWGGGGDDSLTASDSAEAFGGWGGDEMFLVDSAQGFGGQGNDVIQAEDSARASGGDGDDVLLAGDALGAAGSVTLTGGAGQDLFVITDIAQDEDDGGVWTSTQARITDFDPETDTLGFVIDPSQAGLFTLRTSYDSSTDSTNVRLVNEEPYNATVAAFSLAGEHQIDPAQMRFYSDTDLTRINFYRAGTQGDDNLTSPGHPAGSTILWGLSGDDTIHLTQGTVYGGADDDTLTGGADLHGEWGNDSLTGSGDLYGGLGDDVLTLQPSYVGGELESFTGTLTGGFGDDTLTAWGPDAGWLTEPRGASVDAGNGADLIRLSHDMSADAGWGDDTLVLGMLDAHDQGFEDPNRFEYFVESDGQTTLRGEFATTELGGGEDRLFITELDEGGGHVVLDFNPRQDSIGLILPEADRSDFTLALVTNAQSGFAELQIRSVDSDGNAQVKSILLNGVTSGVAPASIQLFASESAALAGTSYATL